MGMKQWMTFGIKTEGADKAAKDIGDVGKAAKGAAKEQEGLNENIETGTSALDGMTGGAIGAFKGVVSGVKKASYNFYGYWCTSANNCIGCLVSNKD